MEYEHDPHRHQSSNDELGLDMIKSHWGFSSSYTGYVSLVQYRECTTFQIHPFMARATHPAALVRSVVQRTARAAVGPWGAGHTHGSGSSACGGQVQLSLRD
jgi:hypothetical protein